MQSQIELASNVKVYVQEKTTSSTADGGWGSYCVAAEHMNIANLFLNKFQKW
jgi:hypothetical protein